MNENQTENVVQTAIKHAQSPHLVEAPNGLPIMLTPSENGEWRAQAQPTWLDKPIRKQGQVVMHDSNSLIEYTSTHETEGTAVYIDADFKEGRIEVISVINGDTAAAPGWNDHRAYFRPKRTPNGERWMNNNGRRVNQAEFAAFLTNCARDIVSKNPSNEDAKYPSAAEVLDFALNLEYTEKTTFKQGYREQDGRINFTFQSEDAGKTETNLKAFERFGIALTPYQGGESYFVEALLKFRIDKNSGALMLWYELQQLEKVVEQATQDIAHLIATNLDSVPIYYGKPI